MKSRAVDVLADPAIKQHTERILALQVEDLRRIILKWPAWAKPVSKKKAAR